MPQIPRLRLWGFPLVGPSHPSVLPHNEIRRIAVEFSEDSLFLPVLPGTGAGPVLRSCSWEWAATALRDF